jgi:alanyl aminopeptidase
MKAVRLICWALSLSLPACGPGPGGAVDTGQAGPPADWPQGRLPGEVTPLAYRLDLTIVPDRPRFSGRVEVELDVAVPVRGFWIHGRNLVVSDLSVTPVNGEPVSGTYTQVSEEGVAWIALRDTVPSGAAMLRIDYDAPFDSGLSGLYKVLVGEDAYAFTQFESTSARKAFPGFDEPAHKTPFAISVSTRAEYRVLSNARVTATTELPDGMQRLTYATTAPLPTYLIAFAVGPLDVVEYAPVPPNAYRLSPLPLRGVATRGNGPRLEFALANTAPLVEALETYFGRAYPFDKLDLVAVPDFAGGAMENAGLITYREALLLFDAQAPVNQQLFFGLIHAHELAHQWFGDLVTMPWWDDIWLNEAFASWLQAKAAQHWRPEFRYGNSVQAQALRAMAADSLDSARQIREPVTSYDDIDSAFDAITYQKGAAVLQMFERYLGPDTFQAGIRDHVRRFAFGSATVYDLMDSLAAAAGEGIAVREPFESFLFQPGLPYVEVGSNCSPQGVELQLTQTRYLPAGSAARRDRTDQGRDDHCLVLTEAKQTFALPGQACPDWVLPNAGGAGYYRWRVPDGMDALAQVFLDELDGGERLSFVDSVVAAIKADGSGPETFLDGLPVIALAPERYPVTAAVTAYQSMLDWLVSPAYRAAANALGMAAFEPRLSLLLQGQGALSPADGTLLKAALTELLALWFDDPDTRERLQAQAFAFVGYTQADAQEVPALDQDLLKPALIVAVQAGGPEFVEYLVDYVRASADARIRQAAVTALAYARGPESLALVREFALSGELRGNEFQTWTSFLLNPGSRDVNWAWLQTALPEVMAVGTQRVHRELPLYLSRGLCVEEDAKLLREQFEGLAADYTISPRRLDQAVETIRLCAALRAAQAGAFDAYFATAR